MKMTNGSPQSLLIIGRGISSDGAKALAEALHMPYRIITDGEYQSNDITLWQNVSLVVISPGVTPQSRLFQEAQQRGLEIISELEFGFRHFQGRLGAVTGTNGKTTTVELATHLLQALGYPVAPSGNIGLPLSFLAARQLRGEPDAPSLSIVEVSSFQLEHVRDFAPETALLLNVESDHINRYPGGMQEYRAVKERIFQHVPTERRFFGVSMKESAGNTTPFHLEADELYCDNTLLLNVRDTALNAPHNRENLLGALAIVGAMTPVSEHTSEKLRQAILSFRTGKHRLELVAEAHEIRYINDSKATNPASVIAALKSLESAPHGNILLLAGGLDKAMDFSTLQAYTKYLKKVFLFGGARDKIQSALANAISCASFETMQEAFAAADATAQAGDIVLLSPACASMDQFKDYQDRGDQFRAMALAAAKSPRPQLD